jgi:hypothetical protein
VDVRASSSVTGWQSVAALVPPQPVVWLFGLPLGHVSLNRGIVTFNAAPVLRALGSVGYGQRQFRRESSTVVEGGVSHRVDDETGFFGSLFAPVVLKEGDEIKLRVKLRNQSALLDALQEDGWTVQRYTPTQFRRRD